MSSFLGNTSAFNNVTLAVGSRMWLWDKGLCTGGEPGGYSIQEEEDIRERKRETQLEALVSLRLAGQVRTLP